MKIAIIGCPGSGKSTIAKKLHERLNIPLYHLDQYYWLPEYKDQKKAFMIQNSNDIDIVLSDLL